MSSERCIYESTLIKQTKVLSSCVPTLKHARRGAKKREGVPEVPCLEVALQRLSTSRRCCSTPCCSTPGSLTSLGAICDCKRGTLWDCARGRGMMPHERRLLALLNWTYEEDYCSPLHPGRGQKHERSNTLLNRRQKEVLVWGAWLLELWVGCLLSSLGGVMCLRVFHYFRP